MRESIEVQGRQCWTLFDTDARNTYVTRDVASLLTTSQAKQPIRTGLGGAVRETDQTAVLEADIEGHTISVRSRTKSGST